MISVRLEGRLGNQLFQYAFVYASARKLGVAFYVDKSIEPFLLPEYFKIKKGISFYFESYFFSIKGFKHIFTHHLRRLFYNGIKKICFLKNVYFSDQCLAENELQKLRDGSMNIGFFQSEKFFQPYQNDIKKLFSIHEKYQRQFNKLCPLVPEGKKLVTIHVRRTDYLDLNLTLHPGYYHKAIESIQSPDNFYVIVSDDPDFAEEEFKKLENKYISRNTPIIDLQFLMNSDICILSNSSFSWWGAYLNTKNSKVIASKFWSGRDLNFEYPVDIIREDWILIDN